MRLVTPAKMAHNILGGVVKRYEVKWQWEGNNESVMPPARYIRCAMETTGTAPAWENWKNTHRRFSRWRDNGERERLFTVMHGDRSAERLMPDAGFVKAHRDSCQRSGRYKRCYSSREKPESTEGV
jgi:hypothetical protein